MKTGRAWLVFGVAFLIITVLLLFQTVTVFMYSSSEELYVQNLVYNEGTVKKIIDAGSTYDIMLEEYSTILMVEVKSINNSTETLNLKPGNRITFGTYAPIDGDKDFTYIMVHYLKCDETEVVSLESDKKNTERNIDIAQYSGMAVNIIFALLSLFSFIQWRRKIKDK